MRLTEILTESQQQELEEGPLGAIGRGLAKGIGGVAKAAGMIGGVAGGVKQAYQKGKATSTAHIAGDVPKAAPDPAAKAAYDKEYAKLTQPAAPAPQASAPAQQAPTQQAAVPAAKQPAAAPQQAAPAATGTAYKQAQQAISGLDIKSKKRIMALLQKEIGAPVAQAPTAVPKAVPAASAQMAGLYDSVQKHKDRMMVEAIINGTQSIYRR
jgi:hypothetical protein